MEGKEKASESVQWSSRDHRHRYNPLFCRRGRPDDRVPVHIGCLGERSYLGPVLDSPDIARLMHAHYGATRRIADVHFRGRRYSVTSLELWLSDRWCGAGTGSG